MYESLQTKSIPKLYTLNQSIESSLQFVTLERGHKPFFLQTIISQTIFAQFFQFLNQQASQTN